MTATAEKKPAKTDKARRASKTPAAKAAKPAKTAATSRVKASEREVVWPSPVKPSLMLLPAKARGARARRKAIRGALIMAAGILAVTVAGYASVAAATLVAQSGLEVEMAKTAEHQKVLNANKQVQDFHDGLLARRTAAAAALEMDISNTRVLTAISEANTVGARYTSISKSPDAAACPVVDPFIPSTAIGCLQISGTAPSIAAIGQLTAGLAKKTDLLTAVYVTGSTMGERAATFKLTVGYTDKAFSFKGKDFDPAVGAAAAPEDTTPAPATGANQEAPK